MRAVAAAPLSSPALTESDAEEAINEGGSRFPPQPQPFKLGKSSMYHLPLGTAFLWARSHKVLGDIASASTMFAGESRRRHPKLPFV